jgi:hypothetical protein
MPSGSEVSHSTIISITNNKSWRESLRKLEVKGFIRSKPTLTKACSATVVAQVANLRLAQDHGASRWHQWVVAIQWLQLHAMTMYYFPYPNREPHVERGRPRRSSRCVLATEAAEHRWRQALLIVWL